MHWIDFSVSTQPYPGSYSLGNFWKWFINEFSQEKTPGTWEKWFRPRVEGAGSS